MVEEEPLEPLLSGVRVIDLAGEPAAMAGRLLADLGAEVLLAEPPDGHPLRALPDRWEAWAAGKQSVVVSGPDDPALVELLRSADIVIDTPGFAGAWTVDPSVAPDSVWVSVTPFGLTGPRFCVARVGSRRDGREREHVLHRRSGPRAGAMQ